MLIQHIKVTKSSGAGTNLKVGGGHRSGAKRRKNIFGRSPPLFGSKSTISRFGERFRDGQCSLVSFLFAVLLLTVPPCPAICKKVEARALRAPWSRRH